MQHSLDEGVTLIVVDVAKRYRGGRWEENVLKKLLSQIEEEEFDTGEEMRVKFTTLDHLLETITTGKLPLDLWGDTIERGARASVFYKDLMFVIPNNNDYTIDNDFITSNGGLILNDQLIESMREEDDIVKTRPLYIVTDETEQQAITYCNNNSLVLDFVRTNDFNYVLVNSIWAKACVDSNEKWSVKDYSLYFQPWKTSVQKLCAHDGTKFVVSALGFSGYELQIVVLWLERLGAIYTEDISGQNTHFIARYQTPEYNEALALGSGHVVSMEWLESVIENGYQVGMENKFYRIPIRITVGDSSSGEEVDAFLLETDPISTIFETYADHKGGHVLQYLFRWGYHTIDPSSTPKTIGMTNGAIISAEVNEDILKVTVQDTPGREIDLFINRRTTRLSEVFQEYAEKRGYELSNCEFYFKDEKIQDHTRTPFSLGLIGSTVIIKMRPVDVGRVPVNIRIRDTDGKETLFRVKKRTRVEKIFQSYADFEDVSLSSLVFYLDGEKIDDYTATPITLELEDDDLIDAHIVDNRSSSPSY